MSFEEFMEDPYGDKTGGSYGGEFTTIAKCKVVSAFQGWNDRQPKLFPYDGSKSGANQARTECEDYCGEKQYPQQGLLTIVYGDDVPTHPNGYMELDWHDFIPVYHSRDKFLQADDIEGELPYDLVLAGLKENRDVFNADKWCLMSQEIDTVKKLKGKTTQKGYPVRIFVVKEIFASREAAYKAAGVELTEENATNKLDGFFGDQSESEDGIELSDTATKTGGWTIEKLKENLSSIDQMIIAAVQGEGTPDSKPLPNDEARIFVCQQYAIELSDLVLVERLRDESEVPF